MIIQLEKAKLKILKNLIAQSIAGSENARFELYSRYSGAMYNVCLRILNNREDAKVLIFFRFSLSASYRFTSSIRLMETPGNALNGFSTGFNMRFGKF